MLNERLSLRGRTLSATKGTDEAISKTRRENQTYFKFGMKRKSLFRIFFLQKLIRVAEIASLPAVVRNDTGNAKTVAQAFLPVNPQTRLAVPQLFRAVNTVLKDSGTFVVRNDSQSISHQKRRSNRWFHHRCLCESYRRVNLFDLQKSVLHD